MRSRRRAVSRQLWQVSDSWTVWRYVAGVPMQTVSVNLMLIIVWKVHWDWDLTVGVVGAVAAVAALLWAHRQTKIAHQTLEASQPSVTVNAYVEKPRRRVRVVLLNAGGSRVTVASVDIVHALGGTGYAQHEILPTVLVEQHASAEKSRGLSLEANDKKLLTLRRPDDSKFEEVRALRALIDVAGKPQVVPLTQVDEQFYVESVDAAPSADDSRGPANDGV